MKPITVLLADDHQIVREGFRLLLEHEHDMKVVGEAANGRQAVQLSKTLCPAVVVMDIAMPLLNGLEATRQILKNSPATRILMLSAHDDDAYVDEVMALGAAGFLHKQTSAHELARAIRSVSQGTIFFSPAISKRTHDRRLNSLNREGNLKKKNNQLSSREVEVLQLIAEGMPNKQVALELGVSFKTVDKHRQHLMSKLDIHDVAGLTRYALAEGIIENKARLKMAL